MKRESAGVRLRDLLLMGLLAVCTWTALRSQDTDGLVRISDVRVSNISEDSAVVSWRTDIPSHTEIEYGIDGGLQSQRIIDDLRIRNHQAVLTELDANTTYFFQLKAQAAKGDVSESSIRFFRTAPLRNRLVPVISGVTIEQVTAHGITVSWQTDQPADSRLIVMSSEGMSRAVSQDSAITSHRLRLEGLAAETEYTVRVFSVNVFGESSNSASRGFTTLSNENLGRNVPPMPVIQIVNKPILNNKIKVSAGESVQFIGSKSYDVNGDSLYFTWVFGDGTLSHEPDPTHTYEEAGFYEVTLVVDDDRWNTYPSNPFVIPILQPALTDRGGLIVADFDGDGLLDYAVSTKDDPEKSQNSRATIGVYSHHRTLLWLNENVDLRINKGFYGLPGRFAAGLSGADVDLDGDNELLHLNTRGELVTRDGATGVIERKIDLPAVSDGAAFWGHFQIVNLRGLGDRDVILQGDMLPDPANERNKFRWLAALALDTEELLWTRSDYDGVRHGGFRAADLDLDGLDEVAGAVMIDHDGSRMNEWTYRPIRNPGHFDAIHFADINPTVPGLEVVLLEEGKQEDDRVAILNSDSVFVYASRNGHEPQNAAIGDFDPEFPGLELWCRSRFNFDQRPWVLDQFGNVVAEWRVNEKKPAHWTIEGIEFIFRIDWRGGEKHFLAAKERHRDGDIAVLDAMTGEFLQSWPEQATRIYIVDVAGDYREEIVVLNSTAGEIRVYWNEEPNERVKPRYWRLNSYKREKLNYNYYSP